MASAFGMLVASERNLHDQVSADVSGAGVVRIVNE